MQIKDWINTELAEDIWNKKYKFENETFDEWLDRISGGNERLKQLIIEKKFLFGGRILANRGLQNKGRKVSYSNCYVIEPPEDNIESIFDCAKKLARTYSYGGGCGVDISRLAPAGSKVNNAARETTGSVSFMDLYSLTTELIGQNGRRGALMISLDCTHPDLEHFIDIKSDLSKVTKANISIRVSDAFMNAVKSDDDWTLKFKRPETGEEIVKTVKARDLFNKMCFNNWDIAEPGILAWDRVTGYNLLSEDDNFEFAGVNPCAEEPLPAGGSCLLGSINLSEFVVNPFTKDAYFNFNEFTQVVKDAVVAMNEVLDEGLPLHPLKEQQESVRNWRQIGVGIMGLADMLIKLGLKYGSIESLDLCSKIGFTMADNAILQSALLASEHGTYPMYNQEAVLKSEYFNACTSQHTKNIVKKFGLRNSQLLTIAPTGSISTMLGISGGIEPIYNISYTRKTESLHGEEKFYKVYTPIVKEYMEIHNISKEEDLPDFFVTAMNLNYKDRIEMQAVWQKHIDASISSTVNVPESFTVEEVKDLYMLAWEKGLKGVTIYRDNCRRSGILINTTEDNNEDKSDNKESKKDMNLSWGTIIEASDDLIGKKRKLITGCGSLHVLAFFDPATGDLLETYLNKGSTGGCNNFMVGLSRMLSLSARLGADVYTIADQLNSSGTCPSYSVRRATKGDASKGSCCPSAIANALLDMQQEVWDELGIEKNVTNNVTNHKSLKTKNKQINKPTSKSKSRCPECHEEIISVEGCVSCKSCGWSRCS